MARSHGPCVKARYTALGPILLAVGVAAAIGGCGGGSGEPTGKVSGLVTLDGEPVEAGQVRFFPTQGRPANGAIKNGKYTLRTFKDGDGALVGQHVVTITAKEIKRKKPVNITPPPGATPGQIKDLEIAAQAQATTETWLVPSKYAFRGSTPLEATVEHGRNAIDFSLESK